VALKWKLILLAVAPLVVATVAVAILVWWQSDRLEARQTTLLTDTLRQQKRAQLIDAVELLRSQVEATLASEHDDAVATRRVQALVSSAQHGPDGYFFGYDLRGVCVLHGREPELVGKNLWDTRDPRGNYVVRSLIASALTGDGFLEYQWQKPSTGKVTGKLAHVALLPRWGWVFGTGVYLDDVDRASALVHEQARASVGQTMRRLAFGVLLAIAAVLLVTSAINVHEQWTADAKLRLVNRQLLALNDSLDSALEAERARLAGELHDGVTQSLAGTKHQFESAARHLTTDPGRAATALTEGVQRLANCIVEVRDLAHDLFPADLKLGLRPALERLIDDVAKRSDLEVVLCGDVGAVHLPERQGLTLYRVAQEATRNAERHAAARRIEVELLSRGRSGVQLRVTDDGRGFDTAILDGATVTSMGLRNMRRRVEGVGGNFSVESHPGRTQIVVALR
jgi:two-component system NarL family sensor kinase